MEVGTEKEALNRRAAWSLSRPAIEGSYCVFVAVAATLSPVGPTGEASAPTAGVLVAPAVVVGAASVDGGVALSSVALGAGPGAEGAGVEVSVERITTTTRRLPLRPSTVSFGRVGRFSP